MPQTLKSLTEFQKLFEIYPDDCIVIDFGATWCGPCKRIAPHYADLEKVIMKELGSPDKVLFYKADVDEAKDLAQYCDVKCMPTFKFYRGGQLVDTLEGADLTQLVKKANCHIVKKGKCDEPDDSPLV
jgi:thioredoxin 1